MRSYEISSELKDTLSKLSKKDKNLYEQTLKKIEEVISSSDIEHYKNLKYAMKDRKRVHVGHFVLVFKYIKNEDKIEFLDFKHHDDIYLRR